MAGQSAFALLLISRKCDTPASLRPIFCFAASVLSHTCPRMPTSAGAYSSTYHPDWSTLAARIAVSDLHKQTDSCFSKNAQRLREHIHPKVSGS